MICEKFEQEVFSHKCESKETKYGMLFENEYEESCGVIGTLDEIAVILAVDSVAMRSFVFIGKNSNCLEEDGFIGKLSPLIEKYRKIYKVYPYV